MSLSQHRLGFHYYPDTDHYSGSDIAAWLPVLESAGASWLTLQATASSVIPGEFIQTIAIRGIRPIIHHIDPVGTLRQAQIYTALKKYADAEAAYVIFFDRPNMQSSWPRSVWSHEALVSRFVNVILPVFEAQLEMGFMPVLPPLEPGGDYWDTAFLETALALIKEQASDEVVKNLTLSIYMWTFGKPLDWGKGGHAAWPDARPYRLPVESQDQRGFQINDWYQEIAERVLGRRMATLVLAGGAGPSHTYASVEALQTGNNEVARYLAENDLDEQLINFNFYPLATAENHRDFPAAWYLRNTPKELPEGSSDEEDEPAQPIESNRKPIEHYVLLGLSKEMNGLQLWQAIAPPVLSARATVGFSLAEAGQACRVSIVGDYETWPVSTEEKLIAQGVEVERIEQWDTDQFLIAASSWVAKKPV